MVKNQLEPEREFIFHIATTLEQAHTHARAHARAHTHTHTHTHPFNGFFRDHPGEPVPER